VADVADCPLQRLSAIVIKNIIIIIIIINEWMRRLSAAACVKAEGGHCEHCLWLLVSK